MFVAESSNVSMNLFYSFTAPLLADFATFLQLLETSINLEELKGDVDKLIFFSAFVGAIAFKIYELRLMMGEYVIRVPLTTEKIMFASRQYYKYVMLKEEFITKINS